MTLFETKYLLRYGIPGWVLIIGILLYFMFADFETLLKLIDDDTLTIVGFSAVLAGIGVPIGYIIHQISLFFSWVIVKDWEGYFKKELELDIKIIRNENGDKIRERYRYLLSQLHGLKALKTSAIISFLVNVTFSLTYKCNTSTILLSIIIGFIIIVVHKNEKYSQANLNYFIKNIDLFNKNNRTH